MTGKADSIPQLSGAKLWIAAVVLGAANFIVVLDTTIANVSVPHISGSIGASASQGTWIITSYAVAEAICVPLTGFLVARFGAVRTFLSALIGFAIFSLLCGMSTTLTMIVLARVGQGLCGGPLMPLTQTLMLRIFPKEKIGGAMVLWSMTTLVGPILGPILGGTISDNWSWHWIFFINLPIIAICVFGALQLLRPYETEVRQDRIDRVGLGLMVLWIGALQIMLDLGRERDWFADPLIVALGIIAVIGFAVFCAWELTEDHPAVDLKVFRHRGFSISVLVIACCFGSYFASVVVIPQWLQIYLGYTATWAGYATALTGIAAIFTAPLVPRLMPKVDPRMLVFGGVAWLGVTTLLRTHWTSGADFWSLALPQLIQGFGMPFFFVTITTLALSSVKPEETASAAGLMSFVRTMAAAIITSIVTTMWDDRGRSAGANLVADMNSDATATALADSGYSMGQIRAMIAQMVNVEGVTIAVNQIFLMLAFIILVSAAIIWLAPRPARIAAPGGGH